ncbi:MAG: hypothetical protein Q4C41_03765 [Eggerthellaceae bacterium]|nr:hypothetical protein [Eggerthellaceae bacterium]
MRISRISPAFDYARLSELVQVWRLATSDDRVRRGARALDVQCDEGEVLSVFFSSGREIFLMVDAHVDGLALSKRIVQASPDDHLSAARVGLDSLNPCTLLQLLINSLAAPKGCGLSFNNVSGHLFVVPAGGIKRRAGLVEQVHALEVRVAQDGALGLHVRTFSSLRLKRYMRKSRIDPERMPRYAITPMGDLRRSFDGGEDELVMRQLGGKKHRMPFLDASTLEGYETCKLGILDETLRLLELRYGGCCSVEFEEFDDSARVSDTRYVSARWREEIRAMFGDERIVVSNETGSDEYGDVCEELAEALADLTGLEALVGEAADDEGKMLVRVIHEKGYFADGGEDSYTEQHPHSVVQHVTVETLCAQFSIPSAVVDSLAKELAIKRDVVSGSIRVFDWKGSGLGGLWTFGLVIDDDGDNGDNGGDRYAFVKVGSEGELDFAFEGWDPTGESAYSDLIDDLSLERGACAIVRSPEGDVDVIFDTVLFAVPDFAEIRKCLVGEQGRISRSREAIDGYLRESTDVSYAPIDERSGYYYAGVVGGGMQTKVPTAAVIRRTETLRGSGPVLPRILPLMDVDFVKTKALTVVPFPLKHLREWLAMNGLAFVCAEK